VADNTLQAGGDTIRTKDRSGIKTEIIGIDVDVGGTESLMSPTNPLPVQNTAGDPDTVASGSITTTDLVVPAPAGAGAFVTAGTPTAGSYVAVQCPGGDSSWAVAILPTGLTTCSLYFEISLDSTNGADGRWMSVTGVQLGYAFTGAAKYVNVATQPQAPGVYVGNTSGAAWFRIRSVGTLSTTATITIRCSVGANMVGLNAPLPPGVNAIGSLSPNPNRVAVALNYNATTPPTTDALLTTLVLQKGAANSTAQTSIPVTAGKTLRITGIAISTRATVATLPYGVLTLRANFSGAAVLASPVIAQVPCSGTAAAIGNMGVADFCSDDGIIELTGSAQLGLSWFGNLATNVVTVSVVGYEY
jgi:hypothetical protein